MNKENELSADFLKFVNEITETFKSILIDNRHCKKITFTNVLIDNGVAHFEYTTENSVTVERKEHT